jgi:tetratricopeptide (TPR) repeat protein
MVSGMKQAGAVAIAFAAGVAIVVMMFPRAPQHREVPGSQPPKPEDPKAEPRKPEDATREVPKGEPPRPDEARRLAESALEELRKGRAADVEALLAEAERLDPRNARVELVRGRLAMVRGEHAAARRHFEASLKLEESDEAHGDLADALFMTGEYAGAVEHATVAKRLFTRAAAYAKLGRDDQALRDYVAFTQENPADAAGWKNRGNHEMRMGLKAHAASSWEKAVARDASLKAELQPLIEAARP